MSSLQARASCSRITSAGRTPYMTNAPRTFKRQRVAFAVRAAQSEVALQDALEDGTDFYSLLGVSPGASAKELKQAYYGMMRECHPDLSGDDEDSSTQFCMMINEIYETLADPAQRAVYDDMAGFSLDAVNPFLETAYTSDRAFVDELSCIGCWNCASVCPRTFKIEDEFGRARAIAQGADSQELVQEAIDTCPVNCIHWVTAPQQALLEKTLQQMRRVAVWSLMSGGGGGQDVFTEASMAWEKRQAAARRRREDAASANYWAAWFQPAAGASMYQQAADAAKANSGADGNGSTGSREGNRIADLAARAARAAKEWRLYQETVAPRDTPKLPS